MNDKRKTRRPVVVSNVETEEHSKLVDTLKILKILPWKDLTGSAGKTF